MSRKQSPLSESVLVPESTHKLMDATFANLKPATRKFLANLLDHALRHGRDEGLRVASDFTRNIQKEYGCADYGHKDYDIISSMHSYRSQRQRSVEEYLWSFSDSAVKGQATEYFAASDLLSQYVTSITAALCDEEEVGKPYYDLVTGKRIDKPARERAPQDAGYAMPRKAANSIKRRVFNYEAILQHLESVKGTAKCYNDLWCLKAVLARRPKEVGGGLYSYKPNYRYAYTGRLYEVGGGLQSCSRLMKQASVLGVSEVHNYDLENSQVRLLHHELASHGITNPLLDELMVKDKAYFANRLGIPVSEWKELLLAFIFGEGEEKQVQRLPTEQSIHAYEEMTASLRKDMRKWRRRISNKKNLKKYRGKYLVKNALGLTEALGDKSSVQLAAFILQGMESYFIYTVMSLANDYGFEVISCEHDGLLTIGEIPQEAIDYAIAETALTCCNLVEKEIV